MVALAVAGAIRDQLQGLVYLGPLREYPERHYIMSGAPGSYVGKSGQRLPDVLLKNPAVVEDVNRAFARFGVGYALRVTQITDAPELKDVFAIRLVDSGTGVNVSLRDVGFGISQVLPVIVQSLISDHRTIFIEQPEIHLHPKLQAELAEVFATSIEEPRGNTFVVETHSEHLMLRLQKLIRLGRLKSSDVSVVFVDRCDTGAQVVPIRLDTDGRFLDEWPGGFFEEDLDELFT